MTTVAELTAQRDELLSVAQQNSARLRELQHGKGQAALKGGRAVTNLMADIRQTEDHNAALAEGVALLDAQIADTEKQEAQARKDAARAEFDALLPKKEELSQRCIAAYASGGDYSTVLDEADALAKQLYYLAEAFGMDDINRSHLITHPLSPNALGAIDPFGQLMKQRRMARKGLA